MSQTPQMLKCIGDASIVAGHLPKANLDYHDKQTESYVEHFENHWELGGIKLSTRKISKQDHFNGESMLSVQVLETGFIVWAHVDLHRLMLVVPDEIMPETPMGRELLFDFEIEGIVSDVGELKETAHRQQIAEVN